jgi:hypothetical protein
MIDGTRATSLSEYSSSPAVRWDIAQKRSIPSPRAAQAQKLRDGSGGAKPAS